MSLDPIRATEEIADDYLRYLSTTFHLRDEELQRVFEESLCSNTFIKGPLLEATPPFEKGKSLRSLIDEGLLSVGFERFAPREFLERQLYTHQEEAIQKVVREDRNLVVASGTGSGKTECFLLPIIDHLLKQEERDELDPGVRALLLYPMNALANDQLKRMRKFLADCPSITFGRYTGETPQSEREARERYEKVYHAEPLENELVSREKMRANPPHILLTNFAMLEYLLLRPSDTVFFDGPMARKWRYLVLDEAHTYTGAKGIEMAMLIRRLKDRVVKSKKGEIRCIATSATLGRGEGDFPAITRFAENLFSEKFEWDVSERHGQDIIAAKHQPMSALQQYSWGRSDSCLYSALLEVTSGVRMNEPNNRVIRRMYAASADLNISRSVLNKAGEYCQGIPGRWLHSVLRGDENLVELRSELEEGPRELESLAQQLFPDNENPDRTLASLVELAANAKGTEEEVPLLPARYHVFVRAIEGAYLALAPSRKLYLSRRETVRCADHEYPVFEIAICQNCGRLYLVGETQSEGRTSVLRQPGRKYFENPANLEYYFLPDNEKHVGWENEDEVAASGISSNTSPNARILCRRCGAIGSAHSVHPPCDCESEWKISVIEVSSKRGQVHKCEGCARVSPSSLVRRFMTGRDAVASVLATSLYQHIPEMSIAIEEDPGGDEPDDWGFSEVVASDEGVQGGGRKLLVFSDSRRDAAFFATYLSRSYERILRRRILVEVLKQNSADLSTRLWRVRDLAVRVGQYIHAQGLYPQRSAQGCEDLAWSWVLYELLQIDRRNSLEQLGILGFSVVQPPNWTSPDPLMKPPWSMNEDEVWCLYEVLLESFRRYGALTYPSGVDATNRIFAPRNRRCSFREKGTASKRGILSWVPLHGHSNSRLDFLRRFADRAIEASVSDEELRNLLSSLWDRTLIAGRSPWQQLQYLSAHSERGEGVVYCMSHEYWELRPGLVAEEGSWYYCDRCHTLTSFNLRGVCPTFRCDGVLRQCSPGEEFADNHYRKLYTELQPEAMVAEEHTAQLTSEAAAELQTQFNEGKVNVISCSTTFELGVDVGDLESVFMRNVPPTPANYAQRAGRAGRRSDSTAFALTYCQRRPHDLAYFEDPNRMVTGRISPPHFELSNEKIVKRHMFAVALAEFWRLYNETFSTVDDFFFTEPYSGPEMVSRFLEGKPDNLGAMLHRIVPKRLHGKVALHQWRWVEGFAGRNPDAILMKAAEEVTEDVAKLEEATKDLLDQGKTTGLAALSRAIYTIKRRSLLSFLSSRNVIPKYGFPVDVVEMHLFTSWSKNAGDVARRLELQRDLRIALSEYAPSSEVVAGGRLWISRYLKRIPKREWPRFRYGICENCGHYQRDLADVQADLDTCQKCRKPIARMRGYFVKPEFGFQVSRDSPKEPGDTQPERTYTTRTYYARSNGAADDGSRVENEFHFVNNDLAVGIEAVSSATLAVLNRAGGRGFNLCSSCGYSVVAGESVEHTHETPWGGKCDGTLKRVDLGHEFQTDVLIIRTRGHKGDEGFWLSVLYALLEGASLALDIDRQDLDGCLYAYSGDPRCPALVLFDDVPGGAGHVQRIGRDPRMFMDVVQTSIEILDGCECGGEEGDSSCYGCLRSYRNQYCHEELNRGSALKFLDMVSGCAKNSEVM